MPTAPRHPCAGGCGRLFPLGPSRCLPCRRRLVARATELRGTSAQRGYMSLAHRAWRAAVLARYPVCVGLGCDRPATVADHIVPIKRGGPRYALSNGQGLCAACHAAKTRREERGYGA